MARLRVTDDKFVPNMPRHPAPAVNRDVAFLYEGFAKGKLLVQRCKACAVLRHPPAPFCPRCHDGDWDTIEASGRGTLHSYTVHHHPPIPPWPTPHVVGLADMAEGFRFVAAIRDAGTDGPTIGQEVTVDYADIGDGNRLPFFRSVSQS